MAEPIHDKIKRSLQTSEGVAQQANLAIAPALPWRMIVNE